MKALNGSLFGGQRGLTLPRGDLLSDTMLASDRNINDPDH